MADHWDSTPRHMLRLDIRSLLQDAAIEDVRSPTYSQAQYFMINYLFFIFVPLDLLQDYNYFCMICTSVVIGDSWFHGL